MVLDLQALMIITLEKIRLGYKLIIQFLEEFKSIIHPIKVQWIYKKNLEQNLMNTVYINWTDRGYLFVHYNQRQDGLGRGHHQFKGWKKFMIGIVLVMLFQLICYKLFY
ncbi:unnamed protein product [Paramecium sonneborni]|uniref:Glycosyl hydrolase family 63 C-terminal domain-containing protein n=1 Tax=Paramecium sonneborni TaxID=65129 RepID=A0A8S1RS39_9CILI|nr:unnamed protein product [Paramecium sonneborni]